MRYKRGFTLIELVVSLAVLALIISSGVNLFFRSLRDTSKSDLRKQVDERARVILGSLTRYFREAKIESLDGSTRTTCLSFGSVTGTSLIASDLYDINSTFDLSDGKLASVSAFGTLFLNPETAVTLSTVPPSTPLFIWYCSAGVPDRIKMQFRITAVGEEGSGTTYEDYVLDLTLRNTGK